MDIAAPNKTDGLKVGKTFLSIKSVNGNLFVVDQNGDMVNGLISCSAKSEVDSFTEITMKVVSYDNEL